MECDGALLPVNIKKLAALVSHVQSFQISFGSAHYLLEIKDLDMVVEGLATDDNVVLAKAVSHTMQILYWANSL